MIFAGLDLSLSSTGGVAVPSGWAGEFSLLERCNPRMTRASTGPLHTARAIRLLVSDITKWLHWLAPPHPDEIRVFYEQAPSSGRSFNVALMVSIAACLADRLLPWGIALEPINQSSARSLILGKMPQGKGIRKPMAVAVARSVSGGAKSPLLSDDECDAFVTLNCALSKIDGEHFFAAPREAQNLKKACLERRCKKGKP